MNSYWPQRPQSSSKVLLFSEKKVSNNRQVKKVNSYFKIVVFQ